MISVRVEKNGRLSCAKGLGCGRDCDLGNDL
jgi:hypothetical protein